MSALTIQQRTFTNRQGPRERIGLCYLVTHAMTSHFLRGQLRHMRECGYDVTLITAPGKELDRIRIEEGIDVRCVPMEREIRPWQDVRSLISLYRELRFIRPKIVNAGTPKAGLLGMLAAWAARVPVRIYTLHGLRMETATGAKRALLAAMERLTCRCATRVTCVSPSLRNASLQHGLAPPEKLVVLGSGSCNGLDISGFFGMQHPEGMMRRIEGRRRLGISPDAFVLGAVGRITRDKGVADLLAVYDRVRNRHPETRLLLIGDFEAGDTPPDACVRRIKAEPGIHWTGPIDDVATYYPIMDVLVHASRREGLPYVPLEAAAAELPIVGYRVTGVVDAIRDGETGYLVSPGDVSALAHAVCRYRADPSSRRRHGLAGRLRVERDFSHEVIWNHLRQEYSRLLSDCNTHGRRVSSRITKRLLDLAIAIPSLLALSPLLAAVAILLRWRLGTPVLFWQQRPGLHGRPFWMAKFRTMTEQRGPNGELLPDDQRLTRLGRFLRSTSLDELPGLWNVLRGEMSIVGPRPLLTQYLDYYTPEQARRHEVKPGITGWAQVHGRNRTSWAERFALDLWYVRNQSLWLDLKILLLTVTTVLSRRGISADDHATMPRFDEQSPTNTSHEQAA